MEEAESATKNGKPARAVELLRKVDKAPGTYERELFLAAATEAQDWLTIVEATEVPASIQELVQRVEAYTRLQDHRGALTSLDKYSRQLQLDPSLEKELRQRVSAQGAMRK